MKQHILANNYWGVHPVARVFSNVNKPPYATMFWCSFLLTMTMKMTILCILYFKLSIDLYIFILYILYRLT
jgi:hypothetical protein